MSTTQETFSGFAATQEETRELPRLNCLGRVSAVGDPKVTASQIYIWQPLTIDGLEGAPSKSFISLLYRPDWLRPGFDPRSLEGDGTLGIVYKMHIGGARDKNTGKITQVSTIAGIAGSEENFNLLAAKIFAAVEGKEDGEVMEIVKEVLTEFINEVSPETGFYSVQKKKETGEIDAAGKKVKVAEPGKREVSGYFFPGAESDKFNLSSAAKSKSVMAYSVSE